MLKQQLRKIYKEKRLQVSSKEKLRLDDLLLIQLQTFDFTGIETVLTYWPMANNNEPNTHLFTGYLRHVIPIVQMAYPVIDTTTETMVAAAIDEHTVYAPNQYGIMQPKQFETIAPHHIQLIFVPLLAYDVQGYRVGFGKGYYDKFIAQCADSAVLMGFSYFEPEPIISNIEPFDIPLHFCITPNTVYEF
jgi:5-formyltetrahydrofolate cyclo-ligase